MEDKKASISIIKNIRAPFTQVPNLVMEDARLCGKAKGVYTYLVGKPDGWKAKVSDIESKFRDKRESVRGALIELRLFGYARQLITTGDYGLKSTEIVLSAYPVFGVDPEAIRMMIRDTKRKSRRHKGLAEMVFTEFHNIQKQCEAMRKLDPNVYKIMKRKCLRTGNSIYDSEVFAFLGHLAKNTKCNTANGQNQDCIPQLTPHTECNPGASVADRSCSNKDLILKKKDKLRKRSAAPSPILLDDSFLEGEGDKIPTPSSSGPQTHASSAQRSRGLLGFPSSASQVPMAEREYSRLWPNIHQGYFCSAMKGINRVVEKFFPKFRSNSQRLYAQHIAVTLYRWNRARKDAGYPIGPFYPSDIESLRVYVLGQCRDYRKGFWKKHFIALAEAAWTKKHTTSNSVWYCRELGNFLGKFCSAFLRIIEEIENSNTPVRVEVLGSDGYFYLKQITDDIFAPRYFNEPEIEITQYYSQPEQDEEAPEGRNVSYRNRGVVRS